MLAIATNFSAIKINYKTNIQFQTGDLPLGFPSHASQKTMLNPQKIPVKSDFFIVNPW
jgi:hypothetical protein